MADNIVENILGKAPQPAQKSTAEQESGGGRDRTAEARIQELVNQKKEYEARWSDATERVNQLEAQVQQLSQRGMGQVHDGHGDPSEDSSPRSWSDLSDSQVRELAFVKGREDPAYFSAGLDELVRRGIDKAAKDVRSSIETDLEKKSYKDQVASFIVQKFGDDAKDPNSELRKRAEYYYSEAMKRNGREAVESIPEIQVMAFNQAYLDLHESEQDELSRLRDENQRLKQTFSMETGSASSFRSPRGDESRVEKLKSGNIRDVIKESSLLKRFTGQR